MSHQLAFINGATLKAIREQRGVSTEYLCAKARVKERSLLLWEQGSEADYPTMKQAQSMAKVLACPLAGFYLEPQNLPEEKLPTLINKRRVWNSSILDESSLNLAMVHLMHIRSDVIEIADVSELQFHDCVMPHLSSEIPVMAKVLRSWIGYTLEEQLQAKSSRKLFLGLRARLEDRGVLVAQFSNLNVEELRGIALHYDSLPIIGVNANDRWPAKCFTVLHELVHLVSGKSTCCNLINREADDEEEVFCNAVAGEYLFSRLNAANEISRGLVPNDIGSIERVAERYSVSRDVVARRLRDCNYLNQQEYEEMIDSFAQQLAEEIKQSQIEEGKAQHKKWRGPSHERIMADTFGSLFCEVVAHGLSVGVLNERDACSVFNVSAEGLEKVFKEALG